MQPPAWGGAEARARIPPAAWLDPNEVSWAGSPILGSGSFGNVVQGAWRGRPSAIKVVNRGAGKEAVELLLREFNVLWGVDHPNIVHVDGLVERDGELAMVMELLACNLGQILVGLLEDGPSADPDPGETFKEGAAGPGSHRGPPSSPEPPIAAPIASLYAILRDVTCAIEYVHSRSLAHRDLKPSNILLGLLDSGKITAKLCDFGLSRRIHAERRERLSNAGTVPYKAPEVRYGELRYDLSVDVFSLGQIIEKDIWPRCKDPRIKQLADLCTQRVRGGGEGGVYRAPEHRPTASQLRMFFAAKLGTARGVAALVWRCSGWDRHAQPIGAAFLGGRTATRHQSKRVVYIARRGREPVYHGVRGHGMAFRAIERRHALHQGKLPCRHCCRFDSDGKEAI